MACSPEVNAFLCYIHKLKSFRFHTGNINNYVDKLKPQTFEDSSQELEQILEVQFENFKGFKEEKSEDIYITDDHSSDTKFDRRQHKITLKIFLENFDPKQVREAVEATLNEIHTDFIEQIILAFPQSDDEIENRNTQKWMEDVLKVWKEAEQLVHDKKAMVIGVADFQRDELEMLYDKVEILPRIDQVKENAGLKEFAETNGVQLLTHNDPIPFPTKCVFKEVCTTNPFCLATCSPCFNPKWTARYAIWADLWLVLESKGYIVKFDDCETLSGSVP